MPLLCVIYIYIHTHTTFKLDADEMRSGIGMINILESIWILLY